MLEAIDKIEFTNIDRIDGLLHTTASPQELEALDTALFQRLRAEIWGGGCRGAALGELIHHCACCTIGIR